MRCEFVYDLGTMKIKYVLTPLVTTLLLFNLSSCNDYSTPSTYDVPVVSGNVTPSKHKKSSRFLSNKNLRPTVSFPCRIAFARVRSAGGNSLIFDDHRDLETQEHQKIIASLPKVAGVVNIQAAFLGDSNTDYDELRKAARRLGANMLAVYQINATMRSHNASMILSVATLGAAPINGNKATASISLIFMDARTGYIYGVMEDQATASNLSSSWGVDSSEETLKYRASKRAFDKIIKRLPQFWPTVYNKH